MDKVIAYLQTYYVIDEDFHRWVGQAAKSFYYSLTMILTCWIGTQIFLKNGASNLKIEFGIGPSNISDWYFFLKFQRGEHPGALLLLRQKWSAGTVSHSSRYSVFGIWYSVFLICIWSLVFGIWGLVFGFWHSDVFLHQILILVL